MLARVLQPETGTHLIEIAHPRKYNAILESLHVVPGLLHNRRIGWPLIFLAGKELLTLKETLGKVLELCGGLGFCSPEENEGRGMEPWLTREALAFSSQSTRPLTPPST